MLAGAGLAGLSRKERSCRVAWREVMYLGGGYKGWATQGTPGYSPGVGQARAGASGRGTLLESGVQN